jgi:D-sedoheptulose 7-phosphate isomerase
MNHFIEYYARTLSENVCNIINMKDIVVLAQALKNAWESKSTVYICGNGGSAGNAAHFANDLIYGAGVKNGCGIRVEALSANASVITCLANDIGYEWIFSQQIKVKGDPKDILIALSGSGNSPNVIRAIEMANDIGMHTFAILGYDGGECKKIAQNSIHFEVDDMQIAEDLQLIVGHICMQWLSEQKI